MAHGTGMLDGKGRVADLHDEELLDNLCDWGRRQEAFRAAIMNTEKSLDERTKTNTPSHVFFSISHHEKQVDSWLMLGEETESLWWMIMQYLSEMLVLFFSANFHSASRPTNAMP